MYSIEISDRQDLLSVAEEWIRETVAQTLNCEGVNHAEIVVAIVDDGTIHQVNRDHLQHDYPTDVISFVYEFSDDSDALTLDGELVVSTETAIRQSAEYGWAPLDELRLYIVHGLLHLCGYDDQTDADRALMRDREQEILQFWGLVPHYSVSFDGDAPVPSPGNLHDTDLGHR